MDTLKAKICVRRDTTANWAENSEVIPLSGEVIVYTDYRQVEDSSGNTVNVPGIKIGDGTNPVADLPFIDDGIDMSSKADREDTVLDTTLSRGRATGSIIGEASLAFGQGVTASGENAVATGENTTASGDNSTAEGIGTTASGDGSHAEGTGSIASGDSAHAEGSGTRAAGAYSHVSGSYNEEDSYASWPEWVSGTEYAEGDKVKITTENSVTGWICRTANSDETFTETNWINQNGRMNYAEIIGNGTFSLDRSNARTLDWEGNERLKGDLYVQCNSDSTGGSKVATESYVTGQKGTAGGIAELDNSGKVPESQLPSYVDDVLEYDAKDFSAWPEWASGTSYAVGDRAKETVTDGNETTVNGYICTVANTSASILPDEWRNATKFPSEGEAGKIYIALDTNKTYRWGGSVYAEIGSDLALGETSSTAYRGDRGKAAYDHAMAKGSAYSLGFYKVQTNSEGHVISKSNVTQNDIYNLGIPKNVDGIYFAVCTTSATLQTKIVGVDGGTRSLQDGTKIRVLFTNGQSYNGSTKISVNGETATYIYRSYGSSEAAGYCEWRSGDIIDFVKYQANWYMVGRTRANFSYPGLTVLSNSIASSSSSTAATSYAVMTLNNNKISKVTGATAGNFASLTSTGDLADSGIGTDDLPHSPVITYDAEKEHMVIDIS